MAVDEDFGVLPLRRTIEDDQTVFGFVLHLVIELMIGGAEESSNVGLDIEVERTDLIAVEPWSEEIPENEQYGFQSDAPHPAEREIPELLQCFEDECADRAVVERMEQISCRRDDVISEKVDELDDETADWLIDVSGEERRQESPEGLDLAWDGLDHIVDDESSSWLDSVIVHGLSDSLCPSEGEFANGHGGRAD